MRRRFLSLAPVVLVMLMAPVPRLLGADRAASPSLAVDSAHVVVSGTSNIHAFTAESKAVRLVNAKVATSSTAATFWTDVVKPGELLAFEIALRTDSLHSTRDGLDKNMYKALKADEHPEISFRLLRIESAANTTKAVGVLKVAGVEREVALALTLTRRDASLVVNGKTEFLMTDFGVTPPKAMLGMLKTDPKVGIAVEAVLSTSAQ